MGNGAKSLPVGKDAMGARDIKLEDWAHIEGVSIHLSYIVNPA